MSKEQRAEFVEEIKDGSERAAFATEASFDLNENKNSLLLSTPMLNRRDYQLYNIYAYCLSVL